MTRFDATEPNHHNRSGQFIWYIKRSTQFVIDSLRQLREALVPGGKLVVKVPAMPALYGAADRAVGHHRRYSWRGFDRALREAGFTDVDLWRFNTFGTLGRWLNAKLLRRPGPPAAQISAFDGMVPVLRRLDIVARAGIGLSLFATGARPPTL